MRRAFALLLVIALPLLARAELKIENIEARHGEFGPKRNSLNMFPGDEIHFHFLVKGVKTDEEGKVDLDLRIELLTATGETALDKTTPNKQVLAFAGASLPSFASFSFGAKTPAGEYTLKLTATDKLGKDSATFERKVTCLKPGFAAVRRELHHDADRKAPAGTTNVLGHRLYYRLIAVGFDRSQKKLDLEMNVQIFDEANKPLLPKPIVVSAASDDPDVVAKNESVTFTGFLTQNRTGKFKVAITVRDKIADVATTWEFPITVVE